MKKEKRKINRMFLSKWYTRIIGVYFLLIVFSLFFDFIQLGHRPETWHKIFHILIGFIVIYHWNNKNFYRPFAAVNGAFFTYVAILGWTFPDFALQLGLEVFTYSDTILHTIIGVIGLLIGVRVRK